jgi:hypothetical protein
VAPAKFWRRATRWARDQRGTWGKDTCKTRIYDTWWTVGIIWYIYI